MIAKNAELGQMEHLAGTERAARMEALYTEFVENEHKFVDFPLAFYSALSGSESRHPLLHHPWPSLEGKDVLLRENGSVMHVKPEWMPVSNFVRGSSETGYPSLAVNDVSRMEEDLRMHHAGLKDIGQMNVEHFTELVRREKARIFAFSQEELVRLNELLGDEE